MSLERKTKWWTYLKDERNGLTALPRPIRREEILFASLELQHFQIYSDIQM